MFSVLVFLLFFFADSIFLSSTIIRFPAKHRNQQTDGRTDGRVEVERASVFRARAELKLSKSSPGCARAFKVEPGLSLSFQS